MDVDVFQVLCSPMVFYYRSVNWNINWNANSNASSILHFKASGYDVFLTEFLGFLPNYVW